MVTKKDSKLTKITHMSAIKKLKTDIFSLLDAKMSLDSVKEIMARLEKVLTKPHNLILLSDGYKYSHPDFYGAETTKIVSYLESRGGKFKETVVLVDIIVKKFLTGVVLLKEDVDEAEQILNTELGVFGASKVFDRKRFDYIVEKHGGRLPLRIKAVPDGTVVPVKNVLMTIENTDPNCAWLTNFVESLILQVWYPITVATLSREVKKLTVEYYRKTTDYDDAIIDIVSGFMLNDFGFRGVSSVESAEIGGFAHLVNFDGSDNVVASKLIMDYYKTDKVYGKSIPATEHSIMTLKGPEGEFSMIKRVLETHPEQMVACVCDSFNILGAVTYISTDLKEMILARPATAPFIIRPDSGHILKTLEEIYHILFENFGYTVNEKGFKVLPPQIRVIQGDGVNLESIKDIFNSLVEQKISIENIALGMGGKLLQADINRDTQNFAIKACFGYVDGKPVNIVKNPMELDENGVQHQSFKKSKQGLMKLVKTPDSYRTVTSAESDYDTAKDELVVLFENGDLMQEYTFEEIRQRAKKGIY